MKLTAEHRKSLIEEFEYSIKMMRATDSPEKKLFYFSGLYGALSRIFNLAYDPQLVFLHHMLNAAHGNINARWAAMKAGDTVIQFPEGYFDKLASISEELKEKIKEDKDTYSTMEKIALMIFVTTGNGYYLYEKGIIKI
jgi:hypothetical protein